MTHEKDFIGQLESYLDEYEGATPLPETVRDAIRAELPSTKQVGPLSGPMRYPSMFNLPIAARYGLAAAVIVAAALLGTAVLNRGENVGSDGTPTPIPTPTPPVLPQGEIDPGTYTIAGEGLNATITLPAGWQNLDQHGVGTGSGQTFMVVTFWPFPDDFNEVYTDPCQWSTSVLDPPPGPTVDDLATALANQAMRGNPTPTDVTIDGYDGKLVEMSVPTDIDFADCDQGSFYSWFGRYHQGPGQIDNVYILDVEGQRQVVIAHYMPGVTSTDLAEQQAILDSIDINP